MGVEAILSEKVAVIVTTSEFETMLSESVSEREPPLSNIEISSYSEGTPFIYLF